MVYVINMRGTSHYKVGFTNGEPLRRMAALQTANPIPLDLVAAVDGGRDLEAKVLRRWGRSSRAEGEWLTLSKKQLARLLNEDLGIKKSVGPVIEGDVFPVTITFRQWLAQQVGRDDVIGDFASDAMNDSGTPDDRAGRNRWYAHLRRRRACREAYMALDDAWAEFMSLRHKDKRKQAAQP